MSLSLTYPGVYIRELPSAVRTIVGVSTSVTAFVGRAIEGPTDKARKISSFAEFIRLYGGLHKESSLSYAVYQYYLNDGKDAIILRVAPTNATAVTFHQSITTMRIEARSQGSWARDLKISINTTDVDPELQQRDPTLFNLIVKRRNRRGEYEEAENFRNLSANSLNERYVTQFLEANSSLVKISPQVAGGPPSVQNVPPPGGEYSPDPNTGNDGGSLNDADITGNAGSAGVPKSGLYLLDDVDIFNLLCIPPYKDDITITSTSAAVYEEAKTYCKKRRAMLLVDPPDEWNDIYKAQSNIDSPAVMPVRDPNAAIWFPRVKCPDPLDGNRIRTFVPCGIIAGVIARTDSQRGVWKAPAGIEATLNGVQDLVVKMTDDDNGQLNPLGINCLRAFPAAGIVVWGARTMRGSDRLVDQWKYLPVRRVALYIEESLYRGTQWVVFEPNDEPLWSQIRLNVGAFMHDLYRKGAFQGKTPRDAYFVKCDNETTTQTDIDRGIVNIVVGFAPLKPAEFVVISIQQITRQEQPQV